MTLVSSPLIGEEKEQPQVQTQPARPQELPVADAQPKASIYVSKALIIAAGVAMIYCLISYGRIFQNYLQW